MDLIFDSIVLHTSLPSIIFSYPQLSSNEDLLAATACQWYPRQTYPILYPHNPEMFHSDFGDDMTKIQEVLYKCQLHEWKLGT